MDLYRKMGVELRALFADLFDPKKEERVREKMAQILAVATQIGGSMQEEAEQLNADIGQFLRAPADPQRVAILKRHALRLEQETREI